MKLKIKNRNTKILKLLKTCFFLTSILLLNCKCGFENKCENPLDPYTIIDVDKSGDTTDIIILGGYKDGFHSIEVLHNYETLIKGCAKQDESIGLLLSFSIILHKNPLHKEQKINILIDGNSKEIKLTNDRFIYISYSKDPFKVSYSNEPILLD
jgi:hypothetical protein